MTAAQNIAGLCEVGSGFRLGSLPLGSLGTQLRAVEYSAVVRCVLVSWLVPLGVRMAASTHNLHSDSWVHRSKRTLLGAKGIATRNKCLATSNKCLTSSNKKLLGARGLAFAVAPIQPQQPVLQVSFTLYTPPPC